MVGKWVSVRLVFPKGGVKWEGEGAGWAGLAEWPAGHKAHWGRGSLNFFVIVSVLLFCYLFLVYCFVIFSHYFGSIKITKVLYK